MNLILRIIIIGALLLLFACKSVYKADPFPEPERESGQTDVLALRAEPLDTVRVAFIGVGARGMAAVKRFMNIEGVRVVALCDVDSFKVAKAQRILAAKGRGPAVEYCGPDSWKKVCERSDVDLIYNCTHWQLHTPIAVYAMEQGKHVAVEVPAAEVPVTAVRRLPAVRSRPRRASTCARARPPPRPVWRWCPRA